MSTTNTATDTASEKAKAPAKVKRPQTDGYALENSEPTDGEWLCWSFWARKANGRKVNVKASNKAKSPAGREHSGDKPGVTAGQAARLCKLPANWEAVGQAVQEWIDSLPE